MIYYLFWFEKAEPNLALSDNSGIDRDAINIISKDRIYIAIQRLWKMNAI